MSASVFKPISLDIPRIRSPMTDRRFLTKGITRAKRALFEPLDHAENQKFFEREFAKQSNNESQKWEFDFLNGVPLSPFGRSGRYVWTPVVPVRRYDAPKKRQIIEEEEDDNSELYAQPAEVVFPVVEVDEVVVDKPSSTCKKQCLITGKFHLTSSLSKMILFEAEHFCFPIIFLAVIV